MIQRNLFWGLGLVALVACGNGNPFTGGTNTDTTTTTTTSVADVLSDNVRSFTYDSINGTLVVEMYALDTTPVLATYSRNAAFDTGDYLAFTVQEDSLDRYFTALVRESADGNVRAITVGDGGQFNKVLQGGYYQRDGEFETPDIDVGPGNGQVTYAGDYAAITNIGAQINNDHTVPAGTDDSIVPARAARIAGQIFLNVNFADMAVNGAVYDRVLLDRDEDGNLVEDTINLEDLALIVTDVTTEGTFLGDVEISGDVGTDRGDYGGIFGGFESAAVGGALYIDSNQGFTSLYDNELERGVFVLNRCGTAGADAICANVQ